METNSVESPVRKKPKSIKEGYSDSLKMKPKLKTTMGMIKIIVSSFLLPNFLSKEKIKQENVPDKRIMTVICNIVIKPIIGFKNIYANLKKMP